MLTYADVCWQAVSNIVNACANGNFKDEHLLSALERAILVFDATSAVR